MPTPGQSVTATVNLEPGTYGVVCLIPAADGKSHAEHGMIGQVTVAQSPDSQMTAPTANAGSIALSEFLFAPSADFTGKGVVAFTNPGVQVHEAILVKLNPGKTVDDVKKFLLLAERRAGRRRSPARAASSDSGRSRRCISRSR